MSDGSVLLLGGWCLPVAHLLLPTVPGLSLAAATHPKLTATVTHQQCLVPSPPAGVHKGPVVTLSFIIFL